MALNKSLTQPFRKSMLLVGAGFRAFFAPYNIALGSAKADTVNGPTILDLQNAGPFSTFTPPTGFYDCGWIKDFRSTPESMIGSVRSGYRGAIRAQYRGQVGETIEFKFREGSRMAFKAATGQTPFNLLSNDTPSTVGPLSGSGATATAITAYTASDSVEGFDGYPTLTFGSAASGVAVKNDWVVVDKDYNLTDYGVVGDAGVPIFQGAVVDVDYLRKTSDYVARVLAVADTKLVLESPFVGGGSGDPTAGTPSTLVANGAKAQKIKGFAAREGGTYVSEWTGLFVCNTIDGAQIAFYYPHLAIERPRGLNQWAIENIGTTDLSGWDIDAAYIALAFDDPIDGETVVSYHAFYPNPGRDMGINNR